MTCEMTDRDGFGTAGRLSASPTDAKTTRRAFWTVSSRGLLERLGMDHGRTVTAGSSSSAGFQTDDPLPDVPEHAPDESPPAR
jgi:hypothetical protein